MHYTIAIKRCQRITESKAVGAKRANIECLKLTPKPVSERGIQEVRQTRRKRAQLS